MPTFTHFFLKRVSGSSDDSVTKSATLVLGCHFVTAAGES